MAGKRKLPLLVEHTLSTLRFARSQISVEFDRELRLKLDEAGAGVACREGCANCCYHPMLITALEGLQLYQWLTEHGRWTPSVRNRVREHAETTKDLPQAVWFLSLIPCPLLDTTKFTCTAYEGRPFTCRVTYSAGDPNDCHPHRIEDSGTINKQLVLAKFHGAQAQAARKFGLHMIVMPLSMAVLLGERIAKGEVDLENADAEIIREYGGVT